MIEQEKGRGMEHVAARSNESTDEDEAEQHTAVVTRMAMLQARFGTAFTEDGLTIARGAIEAAVKRETKLRGVPLGNADEPVGAFAPLRAVLPGDPS